MITVTVEVWNIPSFIVSEGNAGRGNKLVIVAINQESSDIPQTSKRGEKVKEKKREQ